MKNGQAQIRARPMKTLTPLPSTPHGLFAPHAAFAPTPQRLRTHTASASAAHGATTAHASNLLAAVGGGARARGGRWRRREARRRRCFWGPPWSAASSPMGMTPRAARRRGARGRS